MEEMQVMRTTAMEAEALQRVVVITECRAMKLHCWIKHLGVVHVSTRLGQFNQLLTVFVALDLGQVSRVVTLVVVGLALLRGTVTAVTLHTNRPLLLIPLSTLSQNVVRSKLVLVSQQALLENTGFHLGYTLIYTVFLGRLYM